VSKKKKVKALRGGVKRPRTIKVWADWIVLHFLPACWHELSHNGVVWVIECANYRLAKCNKAIITAKSQRQQLLALKKLMSKTNSLNFDFFDNSWFDNSELSLKISQIHLSRTHPVVTHANATSHVVVV
jgi:hypothetical protein